MSNVSFFQQYSQKENHGTNNTILLLRHVYATSPRRFYELIEALTENQDLLPRFQLQIKLSKSVPDAIISQPAFGLIFEAKAGGALDLGQIERHAIGMADAQMTSSHWLICLTKDSPDPKVVDALKEIEATCNIHIISMTYTQIAKITRDITPDHDEAMLEIIEDYERFLERE
ncbi:hypothetical protein, partial [Paracoccus sp. (in: a-proteobacteria)]|uniref:hypothetical protein n=1 Tax=Paracoccus sp. TaxID=267 RepID=UPI003A8367FD